MLNSAEQETLSANKYENVKKKSSYFHIYQQRNFLVQLCLAKMNLQELEETTGPGVIKLFLCSTQLNSAELAFSYLLAEKFSCSAMFSKKAFAIVSILMFISKTNFMLS